MGFVKEMQDTILIVDDNETLLQALEFNLTQAGYRVLKAVDGREALEIALREHPDIIVSDVAMPEMDGVELCRKIRENASFKDVPFIFLTAHGEPEERVRGLRSGADDYIVKPFDIEELIARVEVIHRRMKKDTSSNGLSGDLSHVLLPDILQMLEQSRKKGRLVIQTDDDKGYISIDNGMLLEAVFGEHRGEDALVRMFMLKNGRFYYQMGEVEEGSIMKSIGFTMIEVAKLCDEIEMLKEFIPDDEVKLEIIKTPPSTDDETSTIIRLLQDSPKSINELAEMSGLSVTRTSIIAARLRKDSFVEIANEKDRRCMMVSKKDPIKFALWGMLVGNIESMGILPALQGGEAIAQALEGNDVLEKLSEIDGENNYEFQSKNGFRFVILKACPFTPIYKDIPPWSEKAMRLVEAYNKRSDGGGALHPLCLVHKGIRSAMKAGIVSIGCRSGSTGKMEIAEHALDKVGISKDEAIAMLEGKACLFAIKEG